ncbi:MAG: malate dehydrogenase [Candidatus Sedimenticola endophacoides]
MPRKRIALVGGGQIGGILALLLTQKELGDLLIIDTPEQAERMQGKALDIMGYRPNGGHDVELRGSGDFADLEGADVVVITAGMARRPGMSREDLLDVNLGIVRHVGEQVRRHAPEAFCIVTTNPLDAIVYAFHQASGLPHHRVVGMAGALDSARFRTYLAMETGYSVEDVACLVMGGHGPTMIPLIRTATIGGVPITDLLSPERIEAVAERTRNAGTEIVSLLGSGSAFVSSAAAIAEMVEAHVRDKRRVIASAAYCQGEYGVDGYFMGVPCVIGAAGVEQVIEFPLTPDEQRLFDNSFGAVQASVRKVRENP